MVGTVVGQAEREPGGPRHAAVGAAHSRDVGEGGDDGLVVVPLEPPGAGVLETDAPIGAAIRGGAATGVGVLGMHIGGPPALASVLGGVGETKKGDDGPSWIGRRHREAEGCLGPPPLQVSPPAAPAGLDVVVAFSQKDRTPGRTTVGGAVHRGSTGLPVVAREPRHIGLATARGDEERPHLGAETRGRALPGGPGPVEPVHPERTPVLGPGHAPVDVRCVKCDCEETRGRSLPRARHGHDRLPGRNTARRCQREARTTVVRDHDPVPGPDHDRVPVPEHSAHSDPGAVIDGGVAQPEGVATVVGDVEPGVVAHQHPVDAIRIGIEEERLAEGGVAGQGLPGKSPVGAPDRGQQIVCDVYREQDLRVRGEAHGAGGTPLESGERQGRPAPPRVRRVEDRRHVGGDVHLFGIEGAERGRVQGASTADAT